MGLNVGPGDEVIIPTYSFFATAGVVAMLFARPVFIDIDADTFNIDQSKIELVLTKKTKAIIPVHLFGQCADMDSIMEIAHRHGLYVIEEAAQSLGAEYKDRSADFGDNENNFSKEDIALKIKDRIDYYLHFADIDEDEDKRYYCLSYKKINALGFKTIKTVDEGIDELIKACQIFEFKHSYKNLLRILRIFLIILSLIKLNLKTKND
jgi:hypothetical protein